MDGEIKTGWLLRTATALVAVWLIAPILVIIPLSFAGKSSFRFPPDNWSLRYYARLFTDPSWRDALLSSIGVAVTVAIVATTLGTLGAFALVRGNFPARGILDGLIFAPMVLPTVVLAVGLFSMYLKWHMVGTFAGFVLAHTVLAIPFSVITVRAGLQSLNPDYENAAASLGSRPVTTFAKVTLPLLLPSILAGMAFSFMTSFDEVVVALFIQSPDFQTLPVKMWTSISAGTDPTIAAAATMALIISVLIIIVWQYKPRRNTGA